MRWTRAQQGIWNTTTKRGMYQAVQWDEGDWMVFFRPASTQSTSMLVLCPDLSAAKTAAWQHDQARAA